MAAFANRFNVGDAVRIAFHDSGTPPREGGPPPVVVSGKKVMSCAGALALGELPVKLPTANTR